MTKAGDDLQAVREVVATLEPFSNEDRERIIRWSREKLGMTSAGASPSAAGAAPAPAGAPTPPGGAPRLSPKDIKSFIAEKNPRSDQQLAAVVAFYHQFVAPEADRKDSISGKDLLEACRKGEWYPRPKSPKQTLVNAYSAGILDRAERGSYRLNAVGENLVAMVLPDKGEGAAGRQGAKGKGKPKGRWAGKSTRAKKNARTASNARRAKAK
jgi:hypothetical protein